jgi:hypothetical protein
MQVPGMFLTGLIESFFVARGTSRLSIRRQCTLVSTLGVSSSLCGFALCRSPLQAVAAMWLYNLSHQFNSSGFFPNVQVKTALSLFLKTMVFLSLR